MSRQDMANAPPLVRRHLGQIIKASLGAKFMGRRRSGPMQRLTVPDTETRVLLKLSYCHLGGKGG